jgi:starch-binding outer membrane protein, SusD/RagB family
MLNFYFDQFGLGHYQGIEYPSDDSRHPEQGNNNNVDFIWLPNNGNFAHLYNESYKGIMRANTILNRLPNSLLTDAQKARFEAEARFMRGHFLFYSGYSVWYTTISNRVNYQPGRLQSRQFTTRSDSRFR